MSKGQSTTQDVSGSVVDAVLQKQRKSRSANELDATEPDDQYFKDSLDFGQGQSCFVSNGEGVSGSVFDVKVGDGSAKRRKGRER